MEAPRSNKKAQVLELIRDNPFVSQQELADRLQLSRSAVATYISILLQEGVILGRAYVLPTSRRITCLGGAHVDCKIQSKGTLQFGTSNPAVVTESPGGVARNIAENLGRMGVFPNLITMVGQNESGEEILTHCSAVGVDTSQSIRLEHHNTGTYTAVLDANGEMVVALADMEIYDGFSRERIDVRWHVLKASDMVVVDTNLPKESLDHLIRRCRDENVRLCVIPVSSPKALRLPNDLKGVAILVANMDEASALANQPVTDLSGVWAAGRHLLERGCREVVITMGQKGCAYMDERGRGFVSAPDVNVKDVTGAGDAFASGVIYGLNEGASLQSACQLGTRLSSVTLATKDTVSQDIRADLIRVWMDEIRNAAKGEHEDEHVEPVDRSI